MYFLRSNLLGDYIKNRTFRKCSLGKKDLKADLFSC